MTPKEYLEAVVEADDAYLSLHNHDLEECEACDLTRVHRDVAVQMLRDDDYPARLDECIRIHWDNVMFTREQDKQAE